ncbi:hypothetical protein F4777DRAFT_37379 [Nemania sp. FL0916]|nr:hypothetical protein F4777DRAFT_37379 [Nemania sp. FL0916]
MLAQKIHCCLASLLRLPATCDRHTYCVRNILAILRELRPSQSRILIPIYASVVRRGEVRPLTKSQLSFCDCRTRHPPSLVFLLSRPPGLSPDVHHSRSPFLPFLSPMAYSCIQRDGIVPGQNIITIGSLKHLAIRVPKNNRPADSSSSSVDASTNRHWREFDRSTIVTYISDTQYN